jgi:hypothetical protein
LTFPSSSLDYMNIVISFVFICILPCEFNLKDRVPQLIIGTLLSMILHPLMH